MKRILALLLFIFALSSAHLCSACVGKTLFVGTINSPPEILYAEIISQLVTERTGTTVKIIQFKDSADLYSAVKKGEIGVLVENTERALKLINLKESNSRLAYELAKKEYRKTLNLVWLEPFGASQASAPVISVDTMGHLPALPKLLNKLAGVLNEDSIGKLLKSLKSDGNPHRIARDFLKARKLI